MSILQRTESSEVRRPVLESITVERRRQILAVLVGRSSPLSLDGLADHLAGAERGDASTEDVAGIRVSLVHHHLPELEGADLVEWDRNEGTVTTTDHPALRDPLIRHLVDGAGDEWVAVLDNLADERRSTVLSVLQHRDDPTSRRALAREVAGRDADGEPSGAEVEEALVALHHVDLPKLDDAGLVEYDRDEETVTYRGVPELGE